MGAVLRQRVENKPTTICYASKTLAIAYELHELLAVVYALKKLQPYIFGSKIIINTDHAAIKILALQEIGQTTTHTMGVAPSRIRLGD